MVIVVKTRIITNSQFVQREENQQLPTDSIKIHTVPTSKDRYTATYVVGILAFFLVTLISLYL